ncbi:MAG: GNAT family N-acetyltransferase [Pseudoflavonifractor sp.]|nr:GNAT family N-acetyltransferase [Pseudoflavonifractor sp.]
MDKKEIIKKIWLSAFGDPREYVEWYFDNVYADGDAMTYSHGERVVSSLLLQRYDMTFQGTVVKAGYICGAATVTESRSKGYMGCLMEESLRQSYNRGDMCCTLIPADAHLYHYYCKFGFSPAIYIGVERYTALHRFNADSNTYRDTNDIDNELMYQFFNDMMRRRPCCVQHDATDFRHILDDNRLDGGTAVAIMRDDEPVGIAFTAIHDGECVVTDILAADNDAREATLAAVRRHYEGIAITVLAVPDTETEITAPRGMIRIVNARECLSAIAAIHNSLRCTIRLSDPIISENNNIFTLDDGLCKIVETDNIDINYDINIETLTSIVFGDDTTEKILDFPTERPFMSLMLD